MYYGIVPIFCNKMIPMVQYMSSNIDDIFNHLQCKLGVTDEELLNSIEYDSSAIIICDANESAIKYCTDDMEGVSGVLMSVYKVDVDSKTLSDNFYVELPECLHDHVVFLIIRFDNSIVDIWNEILEYTI